MYILDFDDKKGALAPFFYSAKIQNTVFD